MAGAVRAFRDWRPVSGWESWMTGTRQHEAGHDRGTGTGPVMTRDRQEAGRDRGEAALLLTPTPT